MLLLDCVSVEASEAMKDVACVAEALIRLFRSVDYCRVDSHVVVRAVTENNVDSDVVLRSYRHETARQQPHSQLVTVLGPQGFASVLSYAGLWMYSAQRRKIGRGQREKPRVSQCSNRGVEVSNG